jgi:phosphatidylcholine synthase
LSFRDPQVFPAAAKARAFAVHVFTAAGAALALLAMMAAVRAQWVEMFLLLGIALFVDGIDGTLARRFKVEETLPDWSGDALDFVVDYTTYVFVPAYAIATAAVLPAALAVPLGLAVVMSGALYFADRRMKTADNFFRGFPALWNAAAFYLFLLKPSPWIAAVAMTALIALQFVPIRFVHPFRVARLRMLSIALLVVWAVLGAAALANDLDPGPWVSGGLAVIAVYFFAIGLLRPQPVGAGKP